jgi:hypothetical protein
LVSHDEFENALLSGGEEHLVHVLAGNRTVGHWQVLVTNGNATASPFRNGTTPVSGWIVESGSPLSGSNIFETLTVAAEGSGADAELVLTGTATAQADGAIDVVETLPRFCTNNTTAPSDCVGNVNIGFTATYITDISVLEGQQVLVEVVIQFSTS